MYPDVEDKDGKRVLWLTDWHDSRLSPDFIESMRAMGVVMMGWLPNTTSKCQLPDVSLFGPFKSKRDSLEAKWANSNPGKMVNRKAKVLIACQAMAATFTRQRIFQGAKDTGMLPISRKALLAHPSIKDGDVIRLTTETRCAASLLRAAQMTPPPPQSEETAPVVDQQDEGMFDEAPLFATPDRHEQAESTYTSISQQKPRLGKRRLFSDSSLGPEEAERERKRVHTDVLNLIDKMELSMSNYMACKRRDAAKIIRDAENLITATKASVKDVAAAHNQEMDFIRLLASKVDAGSGTPVRPSTLAMVDEKLWDIENAPRDSYGLAANDVPDVHLVEYPSHAGVNVDVLNKCVSTAYEHVGSRAMKSGTSRRNKDGSVPFKMGSIMSHVGDIEGTSKAMTSFVTEHAQRKEATALTAAANAAAKAAKNKESNEALPQRLIDAKAKISVNPTKNKVGHSKEYAVARLKTAKLLKDGAMITRINLILKTKGSELKRLVAELVHSQAAAL